MLQAPAEKSAMSAPLLHAVIVDPDQLAIWVTALVWTTGPPVKVPVADQTQKIVASGNEIVSLPDDVAVMEPAGDVVMTSPGSADAGLAIATDAAATSATIKSFRML